MLRVFGTCLLTVGLLAPAHAEEPSDAGREAYLAYAVAAAREEGDPLSDAAMLRLLVLQEDLGKGVDPGRVSDGERSLRAEAAVLRVRLAAALDAAEWDRPELLARDLACRDQAATPERCATRVERLREVAGDNAHYHLALATHAWRAGDSPAYLAHMQDAAAAAHYRSPYADYYAALHARFKRVPDHVAPGFVAENDGVPRAATMAMMVSGVYAMPNYQGFIGPCREAEGELRAQCLAIAQLQLASSNTPIEISLAASVVEALGDDGDRALAVQRRREAFWLVEQVAELHRSSAKGEVPAGFEDYFEDFGTRGELEAARRLLTANQRATVPPEGWNSAFGGSTASP